MTEFLKTPNEAMAKALIDATSHHLITYMSETVMKKLSFVPEDKKDLVSGAVAFNTAILFFASDNDPKEVRAVLQSWIDGIDNGKFDKIARELAAAGGVAAWVKMYQSAMSKNGGEGESVQ